MFSGLKRPCPAGRYGSGLEIRSQDCDGYCSLGYYCPEASSSPDQIKCGDANLFCPPGSVEPQHVHLGYYSGNYVVFWHGVLLTVVSVLGDSDETRGAEQKCEPGFYCHKGIRQMCSPGYWGGDYGEVGAVFVFT